MSVTLPIEVYEAFEKGLGKENAKIVVKSLETTIEDATANTWEKTKNELFDRLVSKEEFKELGKELKSFREEIRGQISETNKRIDETNISIGKRIDETNISIGKRIDETNKRIDETNISIGKRIDETNKRIDETNKRIDETNKRIDSVMKIQLWIMGLIAIQAVAVVVKVIFLS